MDMRSQSQRSSGFRKSILGPNFASELLNLDELQFDSSLGTPLKAMENATLPLVGGKALQCWRLAKHGFPVPNAFVLPTYVSAPVDFMYFKPVRLLISFLYISGLLIAHCRSWSGGSHSGSVQYGGRDR